MLKCPRRASKRPVPTPAPPEAALDPYESKDVAAYAVRAALTFNLWVHRRTETVSFPDSETVRRRMTVDFTLPPDDALVPGQTVFVPIHILGKTDLRNFDLTDEQGTSLPSLTAEQNGRVACLGLETLLAGGWTESEGDLRCLLEAIVLGPTGPAAQMAAAEVQSGHLARALKGFSERSEELLGGLLKELARGFLLLTPMEYRPAQRRLAKFSYDAVKNDSSQAKVSHLERGYRRLNGALSSFGFVAHQEDLADLPVGWSSSYHVEVEPPEDMWVAEAALEIAEKVPPVSANRYRPHLRTARRDRDERGELNLFLNPRRESLVLPLFGSAVAIATALAFVPGHLADLDPQVLAGLLLLPFALIAYYVRSAEHRYVSRALAGVRAVAAVPVAAALVVLGMLALGLLGEGPRAGQTAYEVAVWSARAAALAAGLLVPAMIFPTLGLRLRPPVRRVQIMAKDWSRRRRRLVGFTLLALIGLTAVGVLVLVCLAIYIYVPA